MKKLLEFIQQLNKDLGIDLPPNWQKLTDIEIAQRFIQGLNRYLFQTYHGIGNINFQGDEFRYFSEFHRLWKANHRRILNAKINFKQAMGVAQSINDAVHEYGPAILKVTHDTFGLHPQAIAQVRFFTANQDFREPPESPFAKYLKNPVRFDIKEIAEDPVDFLRFLGMTRLSQTDKRTDFARNSARFLEERGIQAFGLAQRYNYDAQEIRDTLIHASNIGYGNKKANMFIRDMVELGVWPGLKHLEAIDVASDINTMKLALRTRILETEIPLVSSFLDIFCYQYEYLDEASAGAWRAVWEALPASARKGALESPCLMDFLLYRIGREYCRDNLVEYKCTSGHKFYYFGGRLHKCLICKNPAEAMERYLPCQIDARELPREEGHLMLRENNLLRTFNGTCIFENACLPKSESFRILDPPKSISVKGQTGWTNAYAFRERGGGGLMS